MEFDWKTRVRQLLYAPAKISDNAKAIGLLLDNWPETPQEACQKHCKADLLKRQNQSLKDRNRNLEEQVSNLQSQLDWRNDELKKVRDYSGCPPDGDLADHFGRLVTERDEFRRLHELERGVISDAKRELGVPEGGSLLEACKAIVEERDALQNDVDRWKIASGLERGGDPDGVRPEKAKEYWQEIEARLIIAEGERDTLQAALDEQMAENGRLAALKDKYHWANGILAEELSKKEAQHERMYRSRTSYKANYKATRKALDVARDAYEFAVEELRAEAAHVKHEAQRADNCKHALLNIGRLFGAPRGSILVDWLRKNAAIRRNGYFVLLEPEQKNP